MKTNKLFIFAVLFMAALLLVGCSKNNDTEEESKNYVQPDVTNAETVAYTNGSASITKGELFKVMKSSYVFYTLVNMIDKDLLADELSSISTTDDFYVKAYNYAIYGDRDIADADKDDETKASSINGLYLSGYKTEEEIENYVKLDAARSKKAYEMIVNAAEGDDNYVSDDTLKEYYEANKYEGTSVSAIIVSYQSENDFLNALSSQGNYAIYDSAIVEYSAGTALRELSGDNTTKLSETEVKELFEKLYEEYSANSFSSSAAAVKSYSYDDLNDASSTLAEKVYGLESGKWTYFATSDSVSIGTLYNLVYVETAATVADYDRATVLNAYALNEIATSTNVANAMAEVRNDADLKFLDAEIGYNYANSYDSDYDYTDTEGSATVVATYNVNGAAKSVTADDLYAKALEINGAYYKLYAMMPYLLSETPSYANIYGSEKDMDKNASLRKASFVEEINSDLESNYDEETYLTEGIYLYSKYGYDNVEDAVKYYYMVSDMSYFYVIDSLYTVDTDSWTGTLEADYEDAFQKVIDNYYNNYYKLVAYELTVTVDADGDFAADSFKAIDATEKNVIDQFYEYAKDRINKAIEDKDEDDSEVTVAQDEIADIIKEYKNAERSVSAVDYSSAYTDEDDGEGNITRTYNDEVALQYFKQYNLVLSYSSYNSGSAIDFITKGSSYTDEINAALLALYGDADMPTSSTEILLADSACYDENGAHILFASTMSSAPSYKSTSTSTYAYDAAYENSDAKMSLSQLAAAFYQYCYDTQFSDAETALADYKIEYSDNQPSLTSLSNYTSKVATYYLSYYFLNINTVKTIAANDTDAVWTEYSRIFAEELGDILD